MSTSLLLTADDLADLLGVHVQWVYKQVRRGRIPHVKLGRSLRFRREAIDAWLKEQER